MSKKIEYVVGKHHHNDKFVGWSVWKTHVDCVGKCCPKTVAEVKWADGRMTVVKADTFKQIVYLLEDKIFVESGE